MADWKYRGLHGLCQCRYETSEVPYKSLNVVHDDLMSSALLDFLCCATEEIRSQDNEGMYEVTKLSGLMSKNFSLRITFLRGGIVLEVPSGEESTARIITGENDEADTYY
ncbi:hypothetical protein LOAG_00093 [Loa loa]|uniref:Uncharacterized protein n=1 Tax=Loa loa TaxID=7209 RepID=A0A1S0UCL9_LOALO|nr:hypothetical protein LOAG_00093 [Loa loa]EFO28404.1 hypothetical protein LOAG_00093 [Loa loa]